ncbi:hypothetical protein E2C01_038304 [Portunus trituberculatus]|uniref:Uncharacterized protein n=1 Tax=Portunus trituberculatus TaxID=210409 RepID=A0A5B7FGH0_PORTR|nr:hypothetical protein [Portunus trituberculatus]
MEKPPETDRDKEEGKKEEEEEEEEEEEKGVVVVVVVVVVVGGDVVWPRTVPRNYSAGRRESGGVEERVTSYLPATEREWRGTGRSIQPSSLPPSLLHSLTLSSLHHLDTTTM